jgi:hypothetical protein
VTQQAGTHAGACILRQMSSRGPPLRTYDTSLHTTLTNGVARTASVAPTTINPTSRLSTQNTQAHNRKGRRANGRIQLKRRKASSDAYRQHSS